ncbi:hypothetical protein HK096_002548 [Nowakowskiella sp. JEL0078]|nr:hypothetical protein HK096_002548 [Nowakowskiella sp. JEL0078]
MADLEGTRKRELQDVDNKETKPKKQKIQYDAFRDLSIYTDTKASQLGRGVDSGYVKCPMCPPSSKKSYARGRGLRTHMDLIHKPLENDATASEWEEQARIAVLEAGKHVMSKKWGASSATEKKDPIWLKPAREGDLDKLKTLIESGWNFKSDVDRHGASAEHWVAGSGHLNCLKYLALNRKEGLDNLVKKKKQKRRDGRTSLHWASRNGHLEIVDWLLSDEGGFSDDVDLRTSDGTTALHFACLGAHLPVVKRLIQAGANPKAKNTWGCTAPHWIAMSRSSSSGHTDLPVSSHTTVIETSKKDIMEICDYLRDELNLGFDESQKEGHTPAHKAAMKGMKDMIEWFISRKPINDVESVKLGTFTLEEWVRIGDCDKSGRKPSDLAREAKEEEILELLLEIGW